MPKSKSGVFRFGSAAVSFAASRETPLTGAAAAEFAALAGRVPPASRAFRGAPGGFSVALPPGFARGPVLPLSLTGGFSARARPVAWRSRHSPGCDPFFANL